MIESLKIKDIKNVSGGDCTCVRLLVSGGDLYDRGYSDPYGSGCAAVCCGGHTGMFGYIENGIKKDCILDFVKNGKWYAVPRVKSPFLTLPKSRISYLIFC